MKKKNNWLIPLIGLVIIILLILIFFTKVIPLGFLGNFSFLPFKIQFSAFGEDDQDLPDSGDKPQEDDCTDLHIANEYRDFYGNTFINTARDSCNLNGIYREGKDISGCSFDKDSFTVDCNTPAMANLKDFCERLDADWICSNSQGFVGCVCDRSTPGLNCWWQLISEKTTILEAATWAVWYDDLPKGKYKFEWSFATNLDVMIIEDPAGDDNTWTYDMTESGTHIFTEDETWDEWGIKVSNPWRSDVQITLKLYQWVCEDDVLDWTCDMFDEPYYWSGDQEYTCGQDWDDYCQGTCPEDYPYCYEVRFGLYEWACVCANYDDEVHPDWKEDGIYHNPHDDTPEPDPDCIDEANIWGYDFWSYKAGGWTSDECILYGSNYCWDYYQERKGGGRITGDCCLFNCRSCEDDCVALGYANGYYPRGDDCSPAYVYVAGTTQCCCLEMFCEDEDAGNNGIWGAGYCDDAYGRHRDTCLDNCIIREWRCNYPDYDDCGYYDSSCCAYTIGGVQQRCVSVTAPDGLLSAKCGS